MSAGQRTNLVLFVLLGCHILAFPVWYYSLNTQPSAADDVNLDCSISEPSLRPTSTSSPSASASNSSAHPALSRSRAPKAEPWSPTLHHTRKALLAAHHNYKIKVSHLNCSRDDKQLSGEVLCSNNTALRLPAAPGHRGWLNMEYSLAWTFGRSETEAITDDGVQALTCSLFDPSCGRWSDKMLSGLYDLTYVAPQFVPSVAIVRKLYESPYFMDAAEAGDQERLKMLRLGPNNPGLAQVGIVLDGFVTESGSVVSRDVFLPCAVINEDIAKPTLVKVAEVAVISHPHQGMFYHMVQDQFYRLFALLPYLQQHPDVHIYLDGYQDYWAESFGDHFFTLCNISKSRIIFSINSGGDKQIIKADVIYYIQELDRNEAPSMGFAQQLRSRLWNLLGLPDHRPWSSLLDPAKRSQVEAFFSDDAPSPVPGFSADHPLDVNFLVMVRTDHYRGRLIANHEHLKSELVALANSFPARLAQKEEDGRERYIRINYCEHHPSMPLNDTFELYAQADVVIGPHGAGFVFMVATRPGAHVIEFVGGYQQNMITTARLGSASYGVVANWTQDGVMEGSPNSNYFIDVGYVVSLVLSVLDSRFYRA